MSRRHRRVSRPRRELGSAGRGQTPRPVLGCPAPGGPEATPAGASERPPLEVAALQACHRIRIAAYRLHATVIPHQPETAHDQRVGRLGIDMADQPGPWDSSCLSRDKARAFESSRLVRQPLSSLMRQHSVHASGVSPNANREPSETWLTVRRNRHGPSTSVVAHRTYNGLFSSGSGPTLVKEHARARPMRRCTQATSPRRRSNILSGARGALLDDSKHRTNQVRSTSRAIH